MKESFEIVIAGGGPAGLTAAIRLLGLGHSVALVEQEAFPRSQIGESLSPGVQHIFEYLHAGHLLDDPRFLHNVPARVAWGDGEATFLSARQRGPSVVVDRGLLDHALLDLAVSKGLHVFQPAKLLSLSFADGIWQLILQTQTGTLTLHSPVVLDARGRKGTPRHERFELAPASIAIWTHVPAGLMPFETRIEAIRDGWLWGSPVPGDRFRLMAFADPESVKGKDLAKVFSQMLSQARLFDRIADESVDGGVKTCPVNTYAHTQPWNQQMIKLGESAFTLDPLSSTGVELAMRFSLQTAIAVHTLLRHGTADVAKAFYESKLTDAVANHAHWTAGYYAQSGKVDEDSPFWEKRRNFRHEATSMSGDFMAMLFKKLIQTSEPPKPRKQPSVPVDSLIRFLWDKPISLSAELEFSSEFAVTDNRVEVKPALTHPNLTRPVIYLNRVELPPLLRSLGEGATYGAAIESWNRSLAHEDVKKVVAFLWGAGILV